MVLSDCLKYSPFPCVSMQICNLQDPVLLGLVGELSGLNCIQAVAKWERWKEIASSHTVP